MADLANSTTFIFESIFKKIHSDSFSNDRPIVTNIAVPGGEQTALAQFIFGKIQEESFDLLPKSAATPFMILYGIVSVLGLTLNMTMIYAFCRAERLRTIRNFFIINLAISDIFLCLFCGPLTYLRNYTLHWPLGRLLCKLVPSLQTACVIVAVFSIAAIAIDRWQLITHPGKDSFRKSYMYLFLLLMWLVAFAVGFPSIYVEDLHIIQKADSGEVLLCVCREMWHLRELKFSYSLIIFIVYYILPMCAVVACYYRICRFLKNGVPFADLIQQKRRQEEEEEEQVNQSIEMAESRPVIEFGERLAAQHGRHRFNRSRKLLFVVAVSFAVCWLPLTVTNLYLDLVPYSIDAQMLKVIFLSCHLIAMLTTCINPILYGLKNRNFKEEFKEIQRQLFSNRAPVERTTTTQQ
nr:G protein-coupled receptor [Proales similis]